MSECCNHKRPAAQVPSTKVPPTKVPPTKVPPEPKTCSHSHPPASQVSSPCCDADHAAFDYLLWGSVSVVGLFYGLHLFGVTAHPTQMHFSLAVYELLNTMAWGLALGIVMVALLTYVPREFVMAVLGSQRGSRGLLRATAAGLLLDLCSHGILMVGAKLYERGASLGQVMAFLIASPWNSLSLTLILIALIGLGWTLVFIVLSAMVALLTGWIFDRCVDRGVLKANPHQVAMPEGFVFWPAAIAELKRVRFSWAGVGRFGVTGLKESRMVIRWLFFGIVLASLIRVFVPEDYFGTYFGPTLVGLGVTLAVATVLEVCSEGSTPIAADIFNRANAPSNSFAFLMTGVSTDYTEIMVLKQTTASWKTALFLPLITLPQIILIALVLNLA